MAVRYENGDAIWEPDPPQTPSGTVGGVPVFQDQTTPFNPGNDPTSAPYTGTMYGWQQALDQLRQKAEAGGPHGAGTYQLAQMFKDPAFAEQWNRLYPGTLPQVGQSLGAVLNNYNAQGSSGFLTEALPMIAAIGGGALGAYFGGAGAVAGDAIPASAAGVGVEGGTAALDAGAVGGGVAPGVGSGVTVGGGSAIPDMTTASDQLLGNQMIQNGGATLGSPAASTGLWSSNTFLPAAAGPTLGSTLTNAAATGAAGTAATQVLNGPAPAPGTPGNPQIGNPDPNGYSNGNISPTTGMPTNTVTAPAGGLGGVTLEKLLSGNVGASDLASSVTLGDLGKILGTGLSMAGSNAQANALKDLNSQYMGITAPSRARYEASMDPSFDINSIPGLSGAMDTSTQSILRGLSTHGNPFGNPGGLAEALKYVTGNVAMPALQQYRNQNAATGGYGAFSSAAPAAATGAINATGNIYADAGRGIATLTNPPMTLESALKTIKGLT